jgi:hypothetical protein
MWWKKEKTTRLSSYEIKAWDGPIKRGKGTWDYSSYEKKAWDRPTKRGNGKINYSSYERKAWEGPNERRSGNYKYGYKQYASNATKIFSFMPNGNHRET